MPPECDSSKNTYTSRPFCIKFGDPLIPINEVGMFRITLPATEVSDSDKLILSYELLNLMALNEKNPKQTPAIVLFDYFPVSQGQFHIRRLKNGLCDYFMIVTGQRHFGAVECMLHSSVLDYRFLRDPNLAHLWQQINGQPCREFSQLFKSLTKNCKPSHLKLISIPIWS